MLGRIALETSDFEEARTQFEIECRLAPDDSLAWYYNVYAAWHCEGDEAALEKLAEAARRGVHLGKWFRQDWAKWKGAAGPRLREALEQEMLSNRPAAE